MFGIRKNLELAKIYNPEDFGEESQIGEDV